MYSLAEKIETIVFSFMRSGIASGGFGSIEGVASNAYIVTVNGRRFMVRSTARGWEVRRDGSTLVGCDPSLCEAAHLAISEG